MFAAPREAGIAEREWAQRPSMPRPCEKSGPALVLLPGRAAAAPAAFSP
jgi:hypothetical protein